MNMQGVGELCKKARIKHGYTLREVGESLLYDFSTIWNFERGKNDNYRILLWYMIKCKISPDEIIRAGGISYEGK